MISRGRPRPSGLGSAEVAYRTAQTVDTVHNRCGSETKRIGNHAHSPTNRARVAHDHLAFSLFEISSSSTASPSPGFPTSSAVCVAGLDVGLTPSP
jgi:hypothetical protein